MCFLFHFLFWNAFFLHLTISFGNCSCIALPSAIHGGRLKSMPFKQDTASDEQILTFIFGTGDSAFETQSLLISA